MGKEQGDWRSRLQRLGQNWSGRLHSLSQSYRPARQTAIERGVHGVSIVHIYAIEETRTMSDQVTRQQFGYSTLLDQPQIDTYYRWEARLHPNSQEREYPRLRDGYVGASNTNSDLATLAINLAANCQDRQDPQLQQQGKPSYRFDFNPTSESVKRAIRTKGLKQVFRSLSPQEQNKFKQIFQEAQKRSAGK